MASDDVLDPNGVLLTAEIEEPHVTQFKTIGYITLSLISKGQTCVDSKVVGLSKRSVCKALKCVRRLGNLAMIWDLDLD